MTRSEKLRATHRKIFAASLALAVVVHIGVILMAPWFSPRPLPQTEGRISDEAAEESDQPLVLVEVRFGPPDIDLGDGRSSREPPDRALLAKHAVGLSAECALFEQDEGTPAHGRVRLRVNGSGRAEVIAVAESTGNRCADEAISAVADALWYRWLPNDRYPPPVDLTQPITLIETRD